MSIVGHSLSGTIVLDFASLYPERIEPAGDGMLELIQLSVVYNEPVIAEYIP
jgi:hypothetical protein